MPIPRIYNHSDLRHVTNVVNQIASQFDATGSFSLANTVTTTTVLDAKIASTSKVFIQARNANAAGASAFVSAVNSGSFVVGHTSASTARNFDYVVFGV